MIIVSRDVVIGGPGTAHPNAPRIGYRNQITFTNVTATSSKEFYPIVNIANPATHLRWWSDSLSVQYVTIAAGLNTGVDYIGFANHNLGTAGVAYQVQGSIDGDAWEDIGDEVIPNDDSPHVQLFPLAIFNFYRVRLTPNSTEPFISVIYIGQMLAVPRRLYVGHIPVTLGRNATISTNKSENGQFLGRKIKREYVETEAEFQNINPAWYRTHFDPFVEASRTLPFFWAWRPLDYPTEVGYMWVSNTITPKNQRANGMMQVNIKMQGISRFLTTAQFQDLEPSS